MIEDALARIAEREAALRAFVALDAAAVRAAARLAPAGPLHGVPIAVKDIFDTAEWPTSHGSAIWAGHRPRSDAAVVARARAAGAVVVGKTVTTEFASYTPGATCNPHDAARTPGGSSSGSAAAVAAGMAVASFGSQTAGSIIRPAAFCGVVGFKPSFGALSRAGMKTLCESFDTAGTFGRRVADAALLAAVAAGRMGWLEPATAAPVIGLCRTDWWDQADPAQRATTEAAARALGAVELPAPDVPWVNERQSQAIAWDTARAFAWEWQHHRAAMSPKFQEICGRGLAMTEAEHALVWADLHRARAAVVALFTRCDLLLTPSAPGEAPLGLAATGAPTFNRLWSVAGGPCLSVPFGRGAHGMPLGVQIVGPPGRDAEILRLGARLEALSLSA